MIEARHRLPATLGGRRPGDRVRTSFRLFGLTLLGLLLFGLVGAAGAAVKAELDRSQVYEGDVFTLTIENTGPQGATPDLSPLNQDFEVLGTGTSNQFSIVNGRASSRSSWNVRLRPLRLGRLEIPPITVGSDQTRPLSIEVSEIPETLESQQNAHAFIEVEAPHDGPVYVQQQIAYRVRLYQDDRVTAGELSTPRVAGALVEQLGGDKRYTVTRDGRRFRVIERNYAIAPEKSGELRIPPVGFRGQLAPPAGQQAPGGRRDRFGDSFFSKSPFANDPFFSQGPFATAGQPLRVSSKAITLDVQPPPASAATHWLPAEAVTLHDSWATNPPALRSGEPVSRIITVQAKGLNGSQLPALELGEPDRTRLYAGAQANDTRSDGDAVYGISRQTFTYIPTQTGELEIPPVELHWWNTTSHQTDSTRLAGLRVDVAPGAAGSGMAPPVPGSAAEETGVTVAEATESDEGWSWLWWLLIIGLVIGAGVRLLPAALRSRPSHQVRGRETASAAPTPADARAPPPAAARSSGPDRRQLLADLEAACLRSDPNAAAHALLALGHAQWPDAPPANLQELAERLGQAGDEIDALDRALYAPGEHAWNGRALWDRFDGLDWKRPDPGGVTKARKETLRPLYPQNT